jgi:hypothetical protein
MNNPLSGLVLDCEGGLNSEGHGTLVRNLGQAPSWALRSRESHLRGSQLIQQLVQLVLGCGDAAWRKALHTHQLPCWLLGGGCGGRSRARAAHRGGRCLLRLLALKLRALLDV